MLIWFTWREETAVTSEEFEQENHPSQEEQQHVQTSFESSSPCFFYSWKLNKEKRNSCKTGFALFLPWTIKHSSSVVVFLTKKSIWAGYLHNAKWTAQGTPTKIWYSFPKVLITKCTQQMIKKLPDNKWHKRCNIECWVNSVHCWRVETAKYY